MDSLVKSDIFFFVATIALVIISIGATVAIVYIILILRNVKNFSDKAKAEGEAVVNDVKMIRESLKSQGRTFKSIFDFFISRVISKATPKKRSSKKEES